MNILKRNQTLIAAFALAAVFAVLGGTNVYAQKKPGGGGGGGETTPVPPGTIHFSQSTADSWYYADMTMSGNREAKHNNARGIEEGLRKSKCPPERGHSTRS